jgi:hypothetical protein
VCQDALPIKFSPVALIVWGTCPHVIILGPGILKWLLDFLENLLRRAQIPRILAVEPGYEFTSP